MLIHEIGATAVRLAHYQHAQSFYDFCDELGMVVWAEIPFISRFINTKEAKEDTVRQMRELIMQNYNHPSICFWGISNEITMGESLMNLWKIRGFCRIMPQAGPVPKNSACKSDNCGEPK